MSARPQDRSRTRRCKECACPRIEAQTRMRTTITIYARARSVQAPSSSLLKFFYNNSLNLLNSPLICSQFEIKITRSRSKRFLCKHADADQSTFQTFISTRIMQVVHMKSARLAKRLCIFMAPTNKQCQMCKEMHATSNTHAVHSSPGR